MLEEFREKHGLSREELAGRLGVSYFSVYKREKGDTEVTRIWELALAEVARQLAREHLKAAGPRGEPKHSGEGEVKSV